MLIIELSFLCFTEEITTQRDVLSTSENSLAAFMSTVLPIAENPPSIYNINTTNDHHSIQKGVSCRKRDAWWNMVNRPFPEECFLAIDVLKVSVWGK